MSAPVATRPNYTHLYGASQLPVLEEVFWQTMKRYPSRRPDLFKIVSTDRDIYQTTEVHDIDLMREMAEGEEYTYKRPLQGNSKTLSVSKFGLGFSVSEEMIADGKFDVVADMTRKLAESALESQEIQAMAVFNGAFSTTTTADGLSLCNAAHTLPSGLTFRNQLSVAADLDTTSLRQAITDFETQFIGDSGIIKKIAPNILLVPSGLRAYAQELIGSDLKADTNNNNMNSLRQEGLRVVSSPHLTDADAWFLLSDSSQHGLRIVQREGVQTKGKESFDTDSLKYKIRYREAIGAMHAYGVFGTAGA